MRDFNVHIFRIRQVYWKKKISKDVEKSQKFYLVDRHGMAWEWYGHKLIPGSKADAFPFIS